MKEAGPNLSELLEIARDGVISFNERRSLVIDTGMLENLREVLLQRHGLIAGSRMIWSFGYANGLWDGGKVKNDFAGKDESFWLAQSAALLKARGWANVRVISVKSSEAGAAGGNAFEFEWDNSWENPCRPGADRGENWESCLTINGYLSGLSAAIARKNMFTVETACCGRGDPVCRAIAKDDWTDEDEQMRDMFERVADFAPENFNWDQILAEILPATERIRELVSQIEARDAEIQTLQMQVRYLQETDEKNAAGELIGKSPAFKKALKNAQTAASSVDTTVLIEGETGTGKELFARFIHRQSALAPYPLITVNCAALPASLVESELFGHERGAFTGADRRKPGRFEVANGGTLFLDEIGELPLETQAKLLRVLQEGEFERVGGTQTIKVKVRIIAATNRNLQELVGEGKFRADLYFRLNVFPIYVPPLRERGKDILMLTDFFVRYFSRRFNKRITSLSRNTVAELQNYSFPGNIRELKHLVERAVLLSRGQTLEIDLPAGDARVFAPGQTAAREELKTLAAVERDYIKKVLRQTNGAVAGKGGAAEILGLPASTLRSRMKKLGIR